MREVNLRSDMNDSQGQVPGNRMPLPGLHDEKAYDTARTLDLCSVTALRIPCG